MQKSEDADNQQGQALSYVVGVYFGDGCVDTAWRNQDGTERKRFRLRAIDQDFVERTALSIQQAFNVECRRGMDNSKRFGKKPLHLITAMSGVGEYLESITDRRRFIPNLIYQTKENTRQFIIGLLDSEGWVSFQFQELGRFYIEVGIGMTSEHMGEFIRMLNNAGVITHKVKTKKYPSGKVMKLTKFNVDSFLRSGIRFNCSRKQNRIDSYLNAIKSLKESGMYYANGASFNDYKRTFRESVQDTLRTNV